MKQGCRAGLPEALPAPASAACPMLRCPASSSDALVPCCALRATGSPQVLIASLKAGGVGLNLTSASRVHLLDPWW